MPEVAGRVRRRRWPVGSGAGGGRSAPVGAGRRVPAELLVELLVELLARDDRLAGPGLPATNLERVFSSSQWTGCR